MWRGLPRARAGAAVRAAGSHLMSGLRHLPPFITATPACSRRNSTPFSYAWRRGAAPLKRARGVPEWDSACRNNDDFFSRPSRFRNWPLRKLWDDERPETKRKWVSWLAWCTVQWGRAP
jgi:hypothetical protein